MPKTVRLNLTLRLTAIALFTVVWVPLSSALGLGGVKYNSYLGEPLTASIQIIGNAAGLGVDEIKVRVVSAAEAKDMGVDVLMSAYRFKLSTRLDQGRLMVDISSRDSIREPFVDLLIELQWPNGIIFREYTLLLDLPPKRASVKPSAPQRDRRAELNSSQRSLNLKSSPRKPQTQAFTAAQNGHYRVRPGDSLSKIAGQWSTGTEHSLHDVSSWILTQNPSAFIGGNANRLIAGAQLQLPTKEGDLTEGLPQSGTPQYTTEDHGTAPVEKTDVQTPTAESNTGGGKLYLGNAEAAKVTEPSAVSKTMSIRAQVESAREMNDLLARENQELRVRIERIENSGYNSTFEQIVALQQQQIDELRRELRNETLAREQATSAVLETPSNDSEAIAVFTEAAAKASDERASTSAPLNPLWWVLLGLLLGAGAMVAYHLLGRRKAQVADKDLDYAPELEELENVDDEEVTFDVAELQEAVDEIDILPDDDLFGGVDSQPSELPESIDDRLLVDADLQKLSLRDDMAPKSVATEEDAVDKMIGTAYIYTSFGKFDEAKALLKTQQQLMGDDPRFTKALADIESQRD